MTGGLLDFFTLEATEYVDQLDSLVSDAVDTAPDAETFARVSRGLRGSATMAKLTGIAELSAGLERLARQVREGSLPWDVSVRGTAIAVVDDLKLLVRGARRWSAAEESRAGARIEELDRIAPRTVVPRPRGRGSEYLATTAANAATGLLEFAEHPGTLEELQEVMKRVRALRGIAALRDLPPLAEVVDAVDSAAKPIEIGHDSATAERRRLFRAAARVLLEGGDAVRRGGVPAIDSVAVREFGHAAETLRTSGTEREADDVVPISALFPDDAADPVQPAANPPTTAAQRFRLEVVSQAEHLRRLVAEGREATDSVTRDRVGRALRSAVRHIGQAAQSFSAIEISNVFLAAERGAAALETRALEVLEEAAVLLSRSGESADSVAPRFLELAQRLAGTPVSGVMTVPGRPTPLSTPAIPRESRKTPMPALMVAAAAATAGAPAVAGATAAEAASPAAHARTVPGVDRRTPGGAAPSGAALHSLLASGIAGLEPLRETRLVEPTVSDEDDVVPIEELQFRGRDALARAVALSAVLRDRDEPADPATLDELYDLLQLAAAE